MNKIRIIIAREFNERVRKKSFIITTILMPVLMLALMAAPTLIMLFAKGDTKHLLVIDDSGIIAPQLENGDDGEYIRLRGFSRGDIEKMNSVKVASGNAEELFTNSDNVIISEAMSRALGIGVGDRLAVASLASSGGSRGFFVVAVAQNEGYFVADSPYTVLGSASGVAQLISPGGVEVFNEIYVDVADGADAESVRDAVAALPEYAELTVSLTVDEAYISTRAGNLSAPVTIAGAAVALLSLVSVALIFTLGVADRRAYAAKLALVGATKRKIAALFFTESAVIAAIGAIVGSVLAVGVFALLIQIVLSSVVSFSVNALLLFGAAVTGGVAAVAASVYPLFRVFRASARENLFSVEKKSLAPVVFSACLGAAVLALLLVENFVSGAMGVLSAVNMVLVIAFAVYAAFQSVILIAAAFYKKNHPDLNLDFITEDRGPRKKSRS